MHVIIYFPYCAIATRIFTVCWIIGKRMVYQANTMRLVRQSQALWASGSIREGTEWQRFMWLWFGPDGTKDGGVIVVVGAGQATKVVFEGSLTALLATVPPWSAAGQLLPEICNQNMPFPKPGCATASSTPPQAGSGWESGNEGHSPYSPLSQWCLLLLWWLDFFLFLSGPAVFALAIILWV